jgi:hypothetical protein
MIATAPSPLVHDQAVAREQIFGDTEQQIGKQEKLRSGRDRRRPHMLKTGDEKPVQAHVEGYCQPAASVIRRSSFNAMTTTVRMEFR